MSHLVPEVVYSMRLTDNLIADFRHGHLDAFEPVWDVHYPRILRTMKRMGVVDSDIEDLLQVSRIALYTARETFAGTGDFSAWVYAVCRHCCARWMRAQSRYQAHLTEFSCLVDPLVDLDSIAEAGAAEYDRRCERAVQALEILTARQRDVVVRRAMHHQSVAQVAAALHCSPGTVKATYHTALHHLRECIQDDETSESMPR